MNIARHPIPDPARARELRAFFDTTLATGLSRWRTDGTQLPDMVSAYLDAAATHAAEAPDDPFIALALHRAGQGAALAFDLATGTEGQVSGPIGDEVWTFDRCGPRNMLNLGLWLQGLCCAVASRDNASVGRLCETAVLRAGQEAPGISDAPFSLPYSLAYAAWATRADDAGSLVNETRARLPPVGQEPSVDLLNRPLLDLLEASITDNAREFDGLLGEALASHRAYWGSPERGKKMRGWIATCALAVAQDARSRGWRVRVTSPYLPVAVLPDPA